MRPALVYVAEPLGLDADRADIIRVVNRQAHVIAQLADRVTYLEDLLEIEHDPAPWMVDIDVKGDRL